MTKDYAKQDEALDKDMDEHMVEVADFLRVKYTPEEEVTAPRYVTERELTSVYALLAYVAHQQNVRQDTVQMVVEAEFNVDDVSKIPHDKYMDAVEFLVDLRMDEVMN